MPVPKCSVCGTRPAEIYQPHTGLRLCKECFFRQIEKRVVLEVKRWKLFEENHTLLLALSGGKDSFTLLDILAQVHPVEKLVALTIVEGIPGGYHLEELSNIRRELRVRGVDHIVVSFKEYFGVSLEEAVEESLRRGLGIRACTFCGVFRRRIMEDVARAVGADRVVTAHNLDDEAQTAIMNILRGDTIGLLKLHPRYALASKNFTPRVKPLRKIYEWESAVYAEKKGYSLQTMDCPYLSRMPTLRLSIRMELYRLEAEHPGSLLKLLESLDLSLEDRAVKEASKPLSLPRCERCGAPTSVGRRICKVCELLEKIGRREWFQGASERLALAVSRTHRVARTGTPY